MKLRKYPVGIQSFETIRRDGYIYIDKTPLIYKMISEGKPYFLSRPRRFGKSLLCSTLAAVFEGRRELFEAFTTEDGIEQPQLFIANTNWRWEKHPVLRFDFSAGDLRTIDQLDRLIDSTLRRHETQYGIAPSVTDTNLRMQDLLRFTHEQTGRRAVVIVDEYDNFILHNIGDKEKTDLARQRFQNLFGPLKEMDDHLQFVFVTGISKFSQMGIFSKLNQLNNISMTDEYDSICGISEEELTTQLRPDIEQMAEKAGKEYNDMLAELKQMYDGYHFSEALTDIYNPFSIVNALNSHKLRDYWFSSGTSRALVDMLAQMPTIDMACMEGVRMPSTAFDLPLESFDDPLPVLYQSGYMTIKDYQPDRRIFTLGFPNGEVRTGFADCLYRHVTQSKPSDYSRSVFLDSYYDFRDDDDLSSFMEAIKAFLASVPYHLDNGNEHHYHALLYTLLTAFGADVVAEEPTAKGRADLVLRMPTTIYIMEIKYDGSATEALEQIKKKGYADKYRLVGRPVVEVGVNFSGQERNITEWISQQN